MRHLFVLLATAMVACVPVQTGAAPVLSVAQVEIVGGDGDGLLDQSECNGVLVTLSNSGSNAVNVTALLSTAVSGLFVVEQASAYPDIPAGGSGENLTSFTLSTTDSFYPGEPGTFKVGKVPGDILFSRAMPSLIQPIGTRTY